MKIQILISFFLGVWLPLAGQDDEPLEPFVCDGSFYQAMAPFLSSALHVVRVDPNTGEIRFDILPAGNLGAPINPIGYRVTDNFIYGISPTNLGLYRLGADGRANRLATISAMEDGLDYPGGAITPDGRYFVLLGVAQGREPLSGSSEKLLFIDLSSPEYPTRTLNLPENTVQSFDLAFDPTDGQLYAFDATDRKLIRINTENGDISALPVTNATAESLGSLFFDPFGNLFAYGNRNRNEKQSSYFSIDKASGQATLIAQGPEAQLTDGCACPYTVAMQHTLNTESVLACTEINLTLRIVNSSGVERAGLSVRNDFPPGFTITGVENPLGGRIVSGVGSNRLLLENVALPLGESLLTITLRTDPTVEGTFDTQASLTGLPVGLGGQVLADDPTTLIREDPVSVSVVPLEEAVFRQALRICPDEELQLAPGLEGVRYAWDDGSTGSTRTIDGPGVFEARVSTDCRTATVVFDVTPDVLEVDLPEDVTLQLGDSLDLSPFIFPNGDFDYQWSSSQDDLDCPDCRDILIRPLYDATYALRVYDPITGCENRDSLQVRVLKDRNLFVPNAFSPNGDGRNDIFFPQSRVVEDVRHFRVFNRWGELLFQRENLMTNDPAMGWDGTLRGRPMPSGVYFYVMDVAYRDGFSRVVKGEVNLLR